MAQVLNTLQKEIAGKYQHFDPANVKHLEAYRMLRYEGRQHADLRFFVEDPYLDVVSMMQAKISEAFLTENKVFVK